LSLQVYRYCCVEHQRLHWKEHYKRACGFVAEIFSSAYHTRNLNTHGGSVNSEIKDPWPVFPDTHGIVFGFLGLRDASTACQVSKAWKQLVLASLQRSFAACTVREWRDAMECGVNPMAGWWTIEGMRLPGGLLGMTLIEIVTMDSNIPNAKLTLTANTKGVLQMIPHQSRPHAACHLPR
jgi:hypothetical protein